MPASPEPIADATPFEVEALAKATAKAAALVAISWRAALQNPKTLGLRVSREAAEDVLNHRDALLAALATCRAEALEQAAKYLESLRGADDNGKPCNCPACLQRVVFADRIRLLPAEDL